MNNFFQSIKNSSLNFAKEEDGAQVIEYALIIAVVSIGLIIALEGIKGSQFSGFITRVQNCLSGGTCISE